ncbi:hypothetical protein LTR27_000412 [Elasticomyces elasticus]|nr:hypothetical protein LTR27_000412 [Elasticomyces elasticus]
MTGATGWIQSLMEWEAELYTRRLLRVSLRHQRREVEDHNPHWCVADQGTSINVYHERRAWNNICTNAIDGSLSTLSGRTAAYRTEILQEPGLYNWLEHQTDDDKCLTRYVYSHGWRITIQSSPRLRCVIT